MAYVQNIQMIMFSMQARVLKTLGLVQGVFKQT